ncbi:MAG: zinc-ribbon domain-containing protein [Clostridia bacterium]|nr:zinc-ribbon domain-containing protein [Clostridia bacterium]
MEKNLKKTHPELSKEWNGEKNGELKPTDVTYGSERKVWWRCEKGHEWMAQIGNRVRGTKCPYCTNHKILKGYNDLETTHPEIAKQWNYERNNGIKPSEVFAAGKYKFWWKCEKGHEWEARLYERKDGNGCPYCSNRKVLEGYNDLQTINSKLAKQWNYEKNKELKPTQITAGSNKCVWWKCKKGHEWKATIASRNNGYGCPYCSHVKIEKRCK